MAARKFRMRISDAERRAILGVLAYVYDELNKRSGSPLQRTKGGSIDLRTNPGRRLSRQYWTLTKLARKLDPTLKFPRV